MGSCRGSTPRARLVKVIILKTSHMKMSISFLPLLTALAGFVSCSGGLADVRPEIPSGVEEARMTVRVLASGFDGTRADATADEKAFSSGVVWAFEGKGDDAVMVQSVPVSPSSPEASFMLRRGVTYRFVAWLNNVPSGDVSTWGALRGLGVFLKGDAPGRFTMTGSAVAVASDGASVGIACVRQAARVRLMSVKVDFADTSSHYNKPFYVTRAFLINVQAADRPFLGEDGVFSAVSPAWYNERQVTTITPEAARPLLVCPDGDSSVPLATIPSNGTLEPGKSFYCYLNTTTQDFHNAPAGVAEKTRLVLECRLGSLTAKPCYYPATLGSVSRNHDYPVSFVIRGAGNGFPDDEWQGWTDVGGGAHSGDWEPGGLDPIPWE